MTKPSFQLPTTTLCTVVWYRDGHRHEQLITTPKSNNDLRNEMLKHRVGFSEIRAIKGVSGAAIIGSMRMARA